GLFTEQHVFFSDKGDTRGCSTCTCGTPTGQTCMATWSLYSDSTDPPSCQTLEATVTSGACVAQSLPNLITSVRISVTTPTGGSCPANPGSPTGSLTGKGPTTLCCIPPGDGGA